MLFFSLVCQVRTAKVGFSTLVKVSLPVKVNEKVFARPSSVPVVGVCLDGSSQDYIDAALEANLMPNWYKIIHRPNGPLKGSHSLCAGMFSSSDCQSVCCRM